MKKVAIASVLVASVVIAACSSSTSSSSSGSTAEGGAPAGNNITVQSNMFVPSMLTIKKGDTVTWTWAGGSHSVTSGANCVDDKSYGTPVNGTVGFTFQHTYTTAGTFEFFCMPHCQSSGMKGTIVVQ